MADRSIYARILELEDECKWIENKIDSVQRCLDILNLQLAREGGGGPQVLKRIESLEDALRSLGAELKKRKRQLGGSSLADPNFVVVVAQTQFTPLHVTENVLSVVFAAVGLVMQKNFRVKLEKLPWKSGRKWTEQLSYILWVTICVSSVGLSVWSGYELAESFGNDGNKVRFVMCCIIFGCNVGKFLLIPFQLDPKVDGANLKTMSDLSKEMEPVDKILKEMDKSHEGCSKDTKVVVEEIQQSSDAEPAPPCAVPSDLYGRRLSTFDSW